VGIRERLTRVRRGYAPHDHRPLGGYLLSMGSFAALAGTLAAAVRATGVPVPDRPTLGDVVLLSIGTHKLSRLLSKEAVTSPLRAPFTTYDRPIGSGEVLEQVRHDTGGVRHAIGELLSCPYCLAVWIGTALTGGLVLAPRATRLASTALTAVTVSDFLQAAYAVAQREAQSPPRRHPGDDG
jgi:hypothetical protein